MMSLAKNVVQNGMEDLTYLVGYSAVNKWFNELLAEEFPDEVDDQGRPTINYAREVLSGMAALVLTSGIMSIIRREEQIIDYLFLAGEAVFLALYARNKIPIDALFNRIKGMRGVKATNRMKILNSKSQESNSFIADVQRQMSLIMQGRTASAQPAQTIMASNSSVDTALRRESQTLKFAELNNKSFSDSLTVKFATGTFTESDRTILQKMVQHSALSSSPISIDELNEFSNVLFVKDSNGKITGIGKILGSIINALGYIQK